MVSDTTLKLTFKKLSLVKFGHSIKEYSQLFEKAIKIPLLLCNTGFSSFTSTKTVSHNKLNPGDWQNQLSPSKPVVKRSAKLQSNATLFTVYFFHFEEYIFH